MLFSISGEDFFAEDHADFNLVHHDLVDAGNYVLVSIRFCCFFSVSCHRML